MSTTTPRTPDLVGAIIAFEQGDLGVGDTLDLFADLVESGQAWTLQGFYGRTAASLIEADYLTPEGEITDLGRDLVALEEGRDASLEEDWDEDDES